MKQPWRNPATAARCDGKARYNSQDKAQKKARAASLRSGDLIIGYKCFDCGFYHIGHADLSQEMAFKREEEALHRKRERPDRSQCLTLKRPPTLQTQPLIRVERTKRARLTVSNVPKAPTYGSTAGANSPLTAAVGSVNGLLGPSKS
jgi:hypothetical protein